MVTMRCDQACAMCKLGELLNLHEPDMPLELISRVARELSPARPLVMLSGGEPFLRKDLLAVIDALNREGLSCGIFTNGLAFDRERVDELVDSGARVRFIGFSLLGPAGIHDGITGRKGAFGLLEDHLAYFLDRRRNTVCFISATISEDNVESLEDIVKLGKEWGVDFIRLTHPSFLTKRDRERSERAMRSLFPGEEIKAISLDCEIDGKERLFVKNIMAIYGKYPGFVYFTPSLSEAEIPLWYSEDYGIKRKCYFCWNSGFIYPNGDVCPCESFYYRLGNVNERGFLDIWNGEKYRRFRNALKKSYLPGCARCCKL
jgi:MoaA/NifB/PqqE/SkfB family radical SAM enzyme